MKVFNPTDFTALIAIDWVNSKQKYAGIASVIERSGQKEWIH